MKGNQRYLTTFKNGCQGFRQSFSAASQAMFTFKQFTVPAYKYIHNVSSYGEKI